MPARADTAIVPQLLALLPLRECARVDRTDYYNILALRVMDMETALEEKKTCIECPKGVAHKRPPEERDD